jgi:putative aldouronate transport system substrate-binding protein
MVKKSKKLLALLMAVLLLGTIVVGCSGGGETSQDTTPSPKPTTTGGDPTTDPGETSKYPDYLNLDSTWPVVKEGHDVTIDFWTTQSETNGGDYEENWYLQYLVDKSNIKINFTQIMSDQVTEQKNLVMNSGNIPDVIYGFGFSPTELVSYGQEQGLLLKLNDYINEELTPTMAAAYEKVPTAKKLITLPEGGIYSIPRIDSDLNEGGISRHFINTKWLKSIGKEIPETLDDLIEILYLFKSEDPGGVGTENVVPIGSADAYWAKTMSYFLNAFGFVSGSNFGPDLRDGEVVFPAGTDIYLEFLKLMKQFYDDGILSPDYYTMDGAALNALIAGGQSGLITEPAYVFTGAEGDWADWWAVKPLTSQYNPKQQWSSYYGYILAGIVISADTEYPEAIMRMSDWFFTKQNAVYVRNGPYLDTEDTYGLFEVGWHIGEDGKSLYYGDIKSQDFPNKNKLFMPAHNESVGVTSNFWLSDGIAGANLWQEWAGVELTKREFDLTNPDQHYRASVTENLLPYCVESMPAHFLYFYADQNAELTDLGTVLVAHAETESAKFITGNRDLSEFEVYLEELESLGLSRYVELYAEAWANYKSN